MQIKSARESLENIRVYQPGKPVETVARETGLDKVIKLASNENPHGPCQAVLDYWAEVIKELPFYPDAECYKLKHAVSDALGVATGQLAFGNGSEEMISLLFHYLISDGDGVILPKISFPAYATQAHIVGADIQWVNNVDHAIDLDGILSAITSKTKLICLANPNNPTGLYLAPKTIQTWLEQIPEHIIVLLDEAYYEYVEIEKQSKAHHLVGTHPNLVVTRSFSKMYAMAGLRIGYAIADPALIQGLIKVKMPFNVNRIAQEMALIAISDQSHVEHCYNLNQRDRTELAQGLVDLGFKPLASECNFLTFHAGERAESIAEAMMRRGVIIRNLAGFAMPGYLRISVGTASENEFCLAQLAQIQETDK